MKIKKIELEVIFNLLKGTEGVLNFADSRIRDSIIKPLTEKLQTYYDDREKIYKAFCINKEDGTPDLLDGNRYQFPPEKLEEINKELIALAEEDEDIFVTDNVAKFKELLERSEYKPKVGEVEIIDKLF